MAKKPAPPLPDPTYWAHLIRERYNDDPDMRMLANQLDQHCIADDLQLVFQRRKAKTPFDDIDADVRSAYRACSVEEELRRIEQANTVNNGRVKLAITNVAKELGVSYQTIDDAWQLAMPGHRRSR
ncbi:hypothetical protein W911_14680 [Hyphomicrobium nitrativorans NL23]|uniref:Uncharacterized protein n=1 Tax=Hyphomicrobium nitrativorans NL23 TaxID=1029756 RepID=V5SIK0_9HYPH|nr:hypothetical protein [Hyphomicrobium nitrativorans]AHB50358.1 hypothetical protein W911_14680 [Hyphomicrobium nitrativorans NL23]